MKSTVHMTVKVIVELDETKFTPEFMDNFNQMITPYDELEQHVEHLAYCSVFCPPNYRNQLEGYGSLSDMGITLSEPEFIDAEIQ